MDNLASDIFKELKIESRRRFVIILILIITLVGSNVAWLIAWNLPKEYTTETYEMQGDDNANVVYSSGEGDISIGENQNQEN